ncbi:hypothetical protein [Lysinibacillus sphaericus]|uniref:hypothetical protein n=1 Tax=Lysinibacillus sphaericus TaxID=1421 RepID=UPI003F797053
MGKAIEVALHAIVVLNTGDDEDELEISGTLIAQAGLSPNNIRETRELWHIADHEIIGIEQDDNHVSLIGNYQTMVLKILKY